MARKPATSVGNAASRSSSKRAAPETPSRQSKRAKAAKKSYVEPESDEDVEYAGSPSSASLEDGEESEYDAESGKGVETEPESDHAEPSSEDDSKPAKGTPRGRPAKRTVLPLHKKQRDEEELWKSGATLTPGTTVVIKRPKAREAGSVPYADDTIHHNTMLFLKDLAAHNDRQWLKAHDADYRTSLQDFTTFLESLSEKVIEADDTVPELPVKDIIFRIYRDIRFSKDPTPYKTHFSAAWSRTGRKGPYAAYYVQIAPGGGSFVGGGLWQPEASALSALRHDVDRKPHKIKRVLTDVGIRRAFFGGVPDDEKKAVKAFVNQTSNQSTALKKHPKGYDSNHKDIELLRLRNFTLGTKLSDEEIVGAGGLERVAELIACLVPFIRYLNSVVMPDGQSSDSSEDDEADGSSGDDGASAEESHA
ncbi:hypothetical protein K458DRAFT_413609 [Lentithecium fluviatile CBS 122367]|uniref:Uncharacterized protein n=1 Tax=Lentithecium fluviatile CBS 122367 TaxID=1168545 RepID=A0A6G1JFI5_9PLEO|nr:hypothetical protein K458DRAFT_413609 [Lentithecium fluviatile CBS 122367]